MSQLKEIEFIENNIPVENITAGKLQVWPFFKYYFSCLYISKLGPFQINGNILRSFFRYFFYGFFNIFRSYDYFIFSASNQRKLINGKYVDKSVDHLIEQLGGRSLVIETPTTTHYPLNKIPTKHIISRHLFYLPVILYSKLFLFRLKIKNEHYLDQILKERNVDLDYKTLVKRHVAQYKIMSLLLKIYRPKAVFMVCSYVHMGFIKAMKDNGIIVAELQHGIISKSHSAYNLYKEMDRNFYPDYLLTFGSQEKRVFEGKNFFIDPKNVLTLGHYYIDHIVNNYSGDEAFRQLKSSYARVVAITEHGMEIDRKVIDFLKEAAKLNENILYIYIPRYDEYKEGNYNFPANIKIVKSLNTYEIIRESDFHSTVFSTCAMEAPSLGTQNILINLENLSEIHYGSVLTNKEITRFVATPEEYVNTISHFKILSKEDIIEANSEIVGPGYSRNLKEILKTILK
jgi:hypothetical protein